MKQRHIRRGDELSEVDELVLRGGLLDPTTVRADAQRMFAAYGEYGISVLALRGASIAELAQEVPLVRFPELTLITVGTLDAAGFRLEPTGRNPRHHTLLLADIGSSVRALVRCEHRVWINPYHVA